MRRLAALTLALVLAGCTGGDQRVVGTVVSVDGDLQTVTAFEVQSPEGRQRFVPGPDLKGFLDEEGEIGAPLGHLWEHLRDGFPVRVTYRVEDGINVAILLEDG
ncbi:MAG: hypothetical protein WEA29_07200 [Acidimicrobiia bacterium]